MPRFSANLGFLYPDRPLAERIAAAARDGFAAVEFHWPYDEPADALRAALERAGIPGLALNTPVGNAAGGDFGLGAVVGREAEFQAGVDLAIDYGRRIGTTAVHCMAGIVSHGEEAKAERTFVENLKQAADKAHAAGMTLLIEPINHRDRPGYALSRVEQAAEIIERTGRPNIAIMFDGYHVQIMQGDLIRRLQAHLPLIGHVQFAAVPSRAEPDEGEVNYAALFRALDEMGYKGFVGAEYKPRGRTEDGLSWMKW